MVKNVFKVAGIFLFFLFFGIGINIFLYLKVSSEIWQSCQIGAAARVPLGVLVAGLVCLPNIVKAFCFWFLFPFGHIFFSKWAILNFLIERGMEKYNDRIVDLTKRFAISLQEKSDKLTSRSDKVRFVREWVGRERSIENKRFSDRWLYRIFDWFVLNDIREFSDTLKAEPDMDRKINRLLSLWQKNRREKFYSWYLFYCISNFGFFIFLKYFTSA